jgi:hypothetical protein
MLLESRSLKANFGLCDFDVEAGESSVQILPRSCLACVHDRVTCFAIPWIWEITLKPQVEPEHAVNFQDFKARTQPLHVRTCSFRLQKIRGQGIGRSGRALFLKPSS